MTAFVLPVFYMVRHTLIDKWVGKKSCTSAFRTDGYVAEIVGRLDIDEANRRAYGTEACWWMDDVKHAKVWTDLRDIRRCKNASRGSSKWLRARDPSYPPDRFTGYEVVCSDGRIIPLDEV